MTEYCTAEDVRKRLSTAGYKFQADRDRSGSVNATEVADSITPAIEYAGNLIDVCVLRAGCLIPVAREAANAWLRDRAVDIAAYRVSTVGGRGIIESLRSDADDAISLLKSTTKIPGLEFNYPQNSNRSSQGPRALNVGR
jgi:phage gp36-like protein